MPADIETFFSYAREDGPFVLRLASDLRTHGVNVWLDQLDIPAGTRWDSAVEHALKSCRNLIVALSPASTGSANVMDEVSFALEQGKRVIPVLHQQCEIPFRLRRLQYVDFTQDYDRALGQLRAALRRASQPAVAPPSPELAPSGPPATETPKPAVRAVDAPRAAPPRRRPRAWILASALGLGVAAVAVYTINRRTGEIRIEEQAPPAVQTMSAGDAPGTDTAAEAAGIELPNLVGRDAAAAQQAVRSLNLALSPTSFVETSQYQSGTVVDQSPGAGTKLAAGASVALTVAAAMRVATPTPATAPNLVGRDVAAAREALRSSRLALGRTTYRETTQYRAGTVMTQSPNAGAQLATGATIDVVVAKAAPAPAPEPQARTIQTDVAVHFANADDPTHVFRKVGDATWGEFQNGPNPRFVFREHSRDRSFITIWDDGRNLGIRLPLVGDFFELNQDGTWRNQWRARRVTHRFAVEGVGGQLLACAGRTEENGPEVRLTFRNSSARAVKVFWVNDKSEEILYADLAPQQSHEQATYVKHRWCVRDAESGAEIAGFLPTRVGSALTIR